MVGGPGADYPMPVTCATSIMGVAPGTLVLAPGSSGDPKNPYMEFAVRSRGSGEDDTGASRLGNPQAGDLLKVTFPPRVAHTQTTVQS